MNSVGWDWGRMGTKVAARGNPPFMLSKRYFQRNMLLYCTIKSVSEKYFFGLWEWQYVKLSILHNVVAPGLPSLKKIEIYRCFP